MLCRIGFAFSFLMLWGFSANAQQIRAIKPENADCSRAVEIKDTLFGPTTAPSGYGTVMEISGDKKSVYAFEQEHNTVWYYFRIWADCRLGLEIIPLNPKDDYDFILYRYSGKTFCQDIKEGKLLPVRSCISRNDLKIGGKTGLSDQVRDEFIHSGPGPSFSKSMDVKKGEIYYLVVDNVYPGGSGHTVVLHYRDCIRPVAVRTKEKTPDKPPVKTETPTQLTLNIKVVDKDTRKPVKAVLDVELKNAQPSPVVYHYDSVSEASPVLQLLKTYIIRAVAVGYFDQSVTLQTPASAGNISQTIELSRIRVGQNVVFDNILFYGNSHEILPESKPSLEAIRGTMQNYPTLTIEIQGHVNCPVIWEDCSRMKEQNMNLSVARAKAVYKYLCDQGIDPDRMTFAGYGDTRMLYPDARSEEKMKKNRRVEILVKGY